MIFTYNHPEQSSIMNTEKILAYNFRHITCTRMTSNERLHGVLHKNGNIYATNGHVLTRTPFEYPEQLEGKTTAKDGSIITEGRPINYEGFIPKKLLITNDRVDRKNFIRVIDKANRIHKALYKEFGRSVYIKIDDMIFSMDVIKKLQGWLKHIKEEFVFTGGKNALIAQSTASNALGMALRMWNNNDSTYPHDATVMTLLEVNDCLLSELMQSYRD